MIRCILLKFYIKPQLHRRRCRSRGVVSYWNSTSNHNGARILVLFSQLYLIEILHQTTTPTFSVTAKKSCILLKFYIKPQLFHKYRNTGVGCILLKFYIKPQPRRRFRRHPVVVSYWNSTSNHNVAHRPQGDYWVVSYWNSTSNHNVKVHISARDMVVSYWNSTSNHNCGRHEVVRYPLYLIEILHQTTTSLEQTSCTMSCILLKFYIKPQPTNVNTLLNRVVSYWNSTSNHNQVASALFKPSVVSYWNSTSNHNFIPSLGLWLIVVSYWNSTSNHNFASSASWPFAVVSYWNSTSNHNTWEEWY